MKNYRIIKKVEYEPKYIVEKREWPLFWQWDAVRREAGGPYRFNTVDEAEHFVKLLKVAKLIKDKIIKYL